MVSTEALNAYLNKILLLSYVSKRNRNVIIMSFSQFSVSITDCHNTSTTIIDFNKRKDGVDTLDEICKELNCFRKTNRWSMAINYSSINVATSNACILMKNTVKSCWGGRDRPC